MSAIVPFAGGSLPAYMKNAKVLAAKVNKDVAVGSSFPSLSIKGKVFTLVKDNERKIMMRADDPDEVMQSINLAIVRANTKARVFYDKDYVDGESDGARPACSSGDGITPYANVPNPQAKKCAVCPHAVWGTGREGNGTRCSVNTRLAVADPEKLDEMQLLLRVPAGSRKNYADAVKAADSRGVPYTALVMKVAFDPAAPSPKLTFKPIGLLNDETYAKSEALYDSDVVKDILGLKAVTDEPLALAAPAVDADELDAALAARAESQAAAAVVKAKAAPKAKPAPAVTESELDDLTAPADLDEAPPPVKAKPAAKAKPIVAVADTGMDELMGDLDTLLGGHDD